MTAASKGSVLDIDGSEIFTIEARNAANQVVATLVIQNGDPFTGDRESTPWALTRPTADISSIRFSGARPGGGRFGLGFDDFSARGTDSGDCLRTASVAWIESVATREVSGDDVTRATAPPERTPWVI